MDVYTHALTLKAKAFTFEVGIFEELFKEFFLHEA